ncbi:probable sucrose-phosphate synthase 1 [Rutidosis leptorrhynchoides]|uniref:probable sucrose-phosphate synthase 1 n=1 Tax=Rutidosis leptorrhynchoides TaxID=125765 RepID=UPI003A991BFF
MAGNDWINSYLEAILDVGPGLEDKNSSLMLRERGKFSPTRYFVEEVITKFDETDLRRSWAMASSIRDSQERNTRLENMSWRIWNLARRKKKLGEESQNRKKQKSGLARVPKPLMADMPEELSEGENRDTVGEISPKGVSTKGGMKRINSMDVLKNFATQQKGKKLYIVLISLHGLIRGENMELGRDSDTGGQVKYVVELARALGAMQGVYRVDLLTRQVSAPGVDWSYGEPTEMLNPLNNDDIETGESSGAYIIRTPFGPKDKYIPKELLWPHIPEFVDGALSYILQMSKVLSEQIGDGKPVWPASIHGHYADAGNAAALLSGALNVPMLFTGHSLGRDKLEQILKQGRQSTDDINTTYRIMRRIEGEEIAVDASEVIITSTRQEIDEQWGLYDGFDPVLERKLRARFRRNVSCFGRFMPRPIVIPPGMEFKHIVPHSSGVDYDSEGHQGASTTPKPPVWSEITRFFTNPHKPIILALARPDPKKNLTTLVKAFGECRPLRELANLTLIMGNRDNIEEMSATNSAVLLSILKLIDKYDMYGQVSYPKHHKQSEVPDIYRLAARTKGVFINPAFIEPFGLTLIEAAAYGLPMVATKNGGPVDIKKALDNGLLIDPHNQQSISDALLKLVADKQLWLKCKQNGLKNIHLFSWPEHCKTYLARIACCRPRHPQWESCAVGYEYEESQSPEDSLRDLNDLKISLDGVINDQGSVENDTTSSIKSKSSVGKKLENLAIKEKSGVNKSEIGSQHTIELRRKKTVFVVAIDCGMNTEFVEMLKMIIEIVRVDKKSENNGLIISTASSISDVHSFIKSNKISFSEFDALICLSGSEIYYPSSGSEGGPTSIPFVLDSDYSSHIDYRWGGDHLKNTLVHWASSISGRTNDKELVVASDSGSQHCFTFNIKNFESIPPVKDLREFLRKQTLRCQAIYCQNGTKLNVIPMVASRAQALRYLYVRWGMSLPNTIVIVGDYGDTDYECLRGGIHKTLVIKGVCNEARKLHNNRSYPLEHVVTVDSSTVVQIEECSKNQVSEAMTKLELLKV